MARTSVFKEASVYEKFVPVSNASLLKNPANNQTEPVPEYGLRPLRRVGDVYGNYIVKTELKAVPVSNATLLQSKRADPITGTFRMRHSEPMPVPSGISKEYRKLLNLNVLPAGYALNKGPRKIELAFLEKLTNDNAKRIVLEFMKNSVAGSIYQPLKLFFGDADTSAAAKEAYDSSVQELLELYQRGLTQGTSTDAVIARFMSKLRHIYNTPSFSIDAYVSPEDLEQSIAAIKEASYEHGNLLRADRSDPNGQASQEQTNLILNNILLALKSGGKPDNDDIEEIVGERNNVSGVFSPAAPQLNDPQDAEAAKQAAAALAAKNQAQQATPKLPSPQLPVGPDIDGIALKIYYDIQDIKDDADIETFVREIVKDIKDHTIIDQIAKSLSLDVDLNDPKEVNTKVALNILEIISDELKKAKSPSSAKPPKPPQPPPSPGAQPPKAPSPGQQPPPQPSPSQGAPPQKQPTPQPPQPPPSKLNKMDASQKKIYKDAMMGINDVLTRFAPTGDPTGTYEVAANSYINPINDELVVQHLIEKVNTLSAANQDASIKDRYDTMKLMLSQRLIDISAKAQPPQKQQALEQISDPALDAFTNLTATAIVTFTNLNKPLTYEAATAPIIYTINEVVPKDTYEVIVKRMLDLFDKASIKKTKKIKKALNELAKMPPADLKLVIDDGAPHKIFPSATKANADSRTLLNAYRAEIVKLNPAKQPSPVKPQAGPPSQQPSPAKPQAGPPSQQPSPAKPQADLPLDPDTFFAGMSITIQQAIDEKANVENEIKEELEGPHTDAEIELYKSIIKMIKTKKVKLSSKDKPLKNNLEFIYNELVKIVDEAEAAKAPKPPKPPKPSAAVEEEKKDEVVLSKEGKEFMEARYNSSGRVKYKGNPERWAKLLENAKMPMSPELQQRAISLINMRDTDLSDKHIELARNLRSEISNEFNIANSKSVDAKGNASKAKTYKEVTVINSQGIPETLAFGAIRKSLLGIYPDGRLGPAERLNYYLKDIIYYAKKSGEKNQGGFGRGRKKLPSPSTKFNKTAKITRGATTFSNDELNRIIEAILSDRL